jgi:hypothetical protein
MNICPDPECGRELRPYPAGTSFVPVGSLPMGARFRIPDLHGDYGHCCVPNQPAVYQVAIVKGDFSDIGLKCVACGDECPFDHTTISVVEVLP